MREQAMKGAAIGEGVMLLAPAGVAAARYAVYLPQYVH